MLSTVQWFLIIPCILAVLGEDGNKIETHFDVPLTPGYLIHLAKIEMGLIPLFERFITGSETSKTSIAVDLIERYMADFKDSSGIILSTKKLGNAWVKGMEVVKNPVAVIRMTSRYITLLTPIREQLVDIELKRKIDAVIGSIKPPTLDDHHETIESLLNLQQFYDDLKPNKLIRGDIFTYKTGISLHPNHILEIASVALEKKMYTLALPWFQIAIEKNLDVARHIKALVKEHDSDYDKQLSRGLYFFEDKLGNNMSSRTMRDVKLETYFGKTLPGHESYTGEMPYYNLINICNGREFVAEKVKKNLFCVLDTSKHTYFKINPIKLEILSLDPYVVMMHKAISPRLFASAWQTSIAISVLNSTVPLSSLKLNRTGTPLEKVVKIVRNPREGGSKHRIFPSANKARFSDDQIGMNLIQKMEMLTGLNIRHNASDLLVVNSYLHGNPIAIHCDHLHGHNDDMMATKGHRLASIIFYMTDAEIGGGTAFPSLGFRVKPEAGSMLFWYTARVNGDIDFRAAHEGCYTALGLRWIGVKFIRQLDNIFKRKCSTNGYTWKLD